MSKTNPIIDVEAISKTFSVPRVRRETIREHVMDLFRRRAVDRLTVLDEISFSVQAGETLGIMGRNGSGKSTLLKILSGIYRPDRGRVVTRAPITPILELGVGWNPELDAIDNIFLIGSVMGLSLAEIRRAIDEILAFAELERFANLKLKHYSSGMGARLAYAIAFKAVREILVLDEIFAVGDEGFQTRCKNRYRELRKAGHTVVLVSHNPAIVEEMCDRAILLENGRIQFEGRSKIACEAYRDVTSHRASGDRPHPVAVGAGR
jgi:ABC-type polysaccharide/polyol phosphate transport system ATPase subunit